MMRSVHWCVGLQGESSDWEHWSVHLDSDLFVQFFDTHFTSKVLAKLEK